MQKSGVLSPNIFREVFFALFELTPIFALPFAGVAELVDALDLGSSAARRGGSTPSTRT